MDKLFEGPKLFINPVKVNVGSLGGYTETMAHLLAHGARRFGEAIRFTIQLPLEAIATPVERDFKDRAVNLDVTANDDASQDIIRVPLSEKLVHTVINPLWEAGAFHWLGYKLAKQVFFWLLPSLSANVNSWIAMVAVGIVFALAHYGVKVYKYGFNLKQDWKQDTFDFSVRVLLSVVFTLPFYFGFQCLNAFAISFASHAGYNGALLWLRGLGASYPRIAKVAKWLPLASMRESSLTALELLRKQTGSSVSVYLPALKRSEEFLRLQVEAGIEVGIVVQNPEGTRLELMPHKGGMHLLDAVREKALRVLQTISGETIDVWDIQLGMVVSLTRSGVVAGISEYTITSDASGKGFDFTPGRHASDLAVTDRGQTIEINGIKNITDVLKILGMPRITERPAFRQILDRIAGLSSLHDKDVIKRLATDYCQKPSASNLTWIVLSLDKAPDHKAFIATELSKYQNEIVPTLQSILKRGITHQRFNDVRNAPEIFWRAADLLGIIGTSESKAALLNIKKIHDPVLAIVSEQLRRRPNRFIYSSALHDSFGPSPRSSYCICPI